jgi:two-component system response regulator
MSKQPILLVEDNLNDVELTLRALERNNIANHVVVAHDGDEALQLLFGGRSGQEKLMVLPQLILLDIKLPKVDGLDVLRRIREDEHTRFIPVVMLTSSQEEQDLLTSYTYGANSYIRKPVDFTAFVEAVRQLGVYWLLLNEVPQRTEVKV